MKYFLAALFFALLFVAAGKAHGAVGVIDEADYLAWGEGMGWVNFKTDHGNIEVNDNKITGHAWSSQYGWINFAVSETVFVSNNGSGTLGGYAWGEGVGWIDFSAVSIDTDGYFHGTATSPLGRIAFNCADQDSCASSHYKVRTLWREADVTPPIVVSGGGGGGYEPRVLSGYAAVSDTLPLAYDQKRSQPKTCTMYLSTELKKGSKKSAEVKKLQIFLNNELKMKLPINGLFGSQTFKAVQTFQSKYASDIFPKIKKPKTTGIVGVMTLQKINKIACGM